MDKYASHLSANQWPSRIQFHADCYCCVWPLVSYYQICFWYGLKYLELNFQSTSAATIRLADAKPDFFHFYCSITKIEDGNLCEICLQNFEITAFFASQYGRQELSTSGEKCSHGHNIANIFVSIFVYIEHIAKNQKIPTGTRSFSLRLTIPERVLSAKLKGIWCREQRRRKISLIACHLKLTEKVRAQNWRPKLQRDDHMRIKRNAENLRVCTGILTTLLGSKNTIKFSMKNASPYFHSAPLVVWAPTLLKRGHYSELSISKFPTPKRKQGCSLHFRTPDPRSEKSMLKMNERPQIAESSQIHCSLISILYQLDPPGRIDAKPQFSSKISSLHAPNNPRTQSPRHVTVKTS